MTDGSKHCWCRHSRSRGWCRQISSSVRSCDGFWFRFSECEPRVAPHVLQSGIMQTHMGERTSMSSSSSKPPLDVVCDWFWISYLNDSEFPTSWVWFSDRMFWLILYFLLADSGFPTAWFWFLYLLILIFIRGIPSISLCFSHIYHTDSDFLTHWSWISYLLILIFLLPDSDFPTYRCALSLDSLPRDSGFSTALPRRRWKMNHTNL